MLLDEDRCYRAVASRDARFDGHFITAVRTTGIYCRPSCPAVTPKRDNVEFLPTAGAAQQRGYRACRRCLPDAVPGSPEWNVRADLAARAMRLIGDGLVERAGVPGLATALGYSPRQLNRVLTAELGAGPLALARAHRAHTARLLIETTPLGMADVAFAAGFASVRQFNDTVRAVYGVPPSRLRAEAARRPGATPGPAGTLVLRLPLRPPFDAAGLLEFFAARALDRVETVANGEYRRTLRLPHGPATARLVPGADHVLATLRLADPRDLGPAVARLRRLLDLDADPLAVDELLGADPALAGCVRAAPGTRLPGTVDGVETALRAVLGQQVSVAAARTAASRLVAALGEPLPPDLREQPDPREHADPREQCDPCEQPDPRHRPGPREHADPREHARPPEHADSRRRSDRRRPSDPRRRTEAAPPGARPHRAAPDRAARPGATLPGAAPPAAGVPRAGAATGPDMLFPSAAVLAERGAEVLTGPARRIATVVGLATALAEGTLVLDPGRDPAQLRAELMALPGIGPWTAGYLAMRVLGDPDELLATDLAVRRGAAALGLPSDQDGLTVHSDRWKPWRSYAATHLWRAAVTPRIRSTA